MIEQRKVDIFKTLAKTSVGHPLTETLEQWNSGISLEVLFRSDLKTVRMKKILSKSVKNIK